MSRSDRDLVARFLERRDDDAFLAIYDRHVGVMYRCALARLRSPGAAESAVQEAWLRATRSLDRFEWRSALRSWLVGITLNCCREQLRRGLRIVDAPAEQNEPGPAREEPAGLAVDLARALATLPERARDVLLLHDVEGFTHEEVGTALGIAAGTSKSQLSRARSLLRRALA